MPDEKFALPCLSAEAALARVRAGTLTLLDLRKPDALRKAGRGIAGALHRDPYAFSHDDPLTHAKFPIAVFCVHGHEVSQYGCALLLLHGVDAVFVRGGFAALTAAGAAQEALK